jgi:AcrR family transcriptional regulator
MTNIGIQDAMETRDRRPGLPRAFLEHQRRLRATLGAAEVAHEFGIGAVTVTAICEVTQMGKMSFYDVFANLGECLTFGLAASYERTFAGVREAAGAEGDWPDRVQQGITRFYGAVAAEPLLTELCLVHCFGARGSGGGHDFEAGVALVAELIGDGREAARERLGDAYREPAPLAEDCLAGMIVSLAGLKLSQERAGELPGAAAEMVFLVLSTFLGPHEAGRAWSGLRETD